MQTVSHCPACHSLWHTIPIHKHLHEDYSTPWFYSTVIAVQSWATDKTEYYLCPDCGTQFNLDGTQQ